MHVQASVLRHVRRTECQQGHIHADFGNMESVRHDWWRNAERCQVGDDRFPAVGTPRATDFVKVWMQQLLQPLAAATNPWVVKLNFKSKEMIQQAAHS